MSHGVVGRRLTSLGLARSSRPPCTGSRGPPWAGSSPSLDAEDVALARPVPEVPSPRQAERVWALGKRVRSCTAAHESAMEDAGGPALWCPQTGLSVPRLKWASVAPADWTWPLCLPPWRAGLSCTCGGGGQRPVQSWAVPSLAAAPPLPSCTWELGCCCGERSRVFLAQLCGCRPGNRVVTGVPASLCLVRWRLPRPPLALSLLASEPHAQPDLPTPPLERSPQALLPGQHLARFRRPHWTKPHPQPWPCSPDCPPHPPTHSAGPGGRAGAETEPGAGRRPRVP